MKIGNCCAYGNALRFMFQRRAKAVIGTGALIFCALFGAGAAAGDKLTIEPTQVASAHADPMYDLERRIRAAHKDLTADVSRILPSGDYRINSDFRPKSPLGEQAYVMEVVAALREIGRVSNKSDPPVKEIQLHAFATHADASGRSSLRKAFDLVLKSPKLETIDWNGISDVQLLNLADVKFSPLGQKIVRTYCLEAGDQLPKLFCHGAWF